MLLRSKIQGKKRRAIFCSYQLIVFLFVFTYLYKTCAARCCFQFFVLSHSKVLAICVV